MNSIEKYHAQRRSKALEFQRKEPVRQNRKEKSPEKPPANNSAPEPQKEVDPYSVRNYLGKNVDTRA